MNTTMTSSATIEADPTVPMIHITRDFAATPAQLFRAHTDPELFARWVGPDGTVVEVSDAWLALLGYRREEVVGRPLAEFLAAECADRHAREHWPALLAGQDLQRRLDSLELWLTRLDDKLAQVAAPARAEGRRRLDVWQAVLIALLVGVIGIASAAMLMYSGS